MEVSKDGDDHKQFYADVVAAGGLNHALNRQFAQMNSPLKAISGVEGLQLGPSYTRIEHGERFSQIYMGARERAFLPDFWWRGVCMGMLITTSLEELAQSVHCWNAEEYLVAQMASAFPKFSLSRENAAAFEEGNEIEAEWRTYCVDNAGTPMAPIIELASRHERLGQLFPYMSMGRLGFSRTTGYPYTFDLPLIRVDKGLFSVVGYSGVEVFGSFESAQEAIDRVVSLLPPYCTRAISGTLRDLPETDPCRQSEEEDR